MTVGLPQSTAEIAARVERIDAAVLEIADENIAAELSEAIGRARQSPGRIEHAVFGKASQQVTVGVENVDETTSRSADIIHLLRILSGVGHPKITVDILDPKRGETGRNVLIDELPVRGCRAEVAIEHVYFGAPKVGGVNVIAVDVRPEG